MIRWTDHEVTFWSRRSRPTRPLAQLKDRVKKRRAAKLARWARRGEVEWRGSHLRVALFVAQQELFREMMAMQLRPWREA